MQNQKTVFLTFILFFFILSSISAQNSQTATLKSKADSLFEAQNYTEAFDIYDNLLEQENHFTPKVLLRMAFIKEGAGETAGALYYLNLYNVYLPDEAVQRKIEDLARRHNLQGYEFAEQELFAEYYNNYFPYLALGLLLGAGLFALYIVFFVEKRFSLPHFAFIVYLGLLTAVFNLDYTIYSKGVIQGQETPLMRGPSPAAGLARMVSPGHKVAVLGKQDMWYKIQWKDSSYFVAQHRLAPLIR